MKHGNKQKHGKQNLLINQSPAQLDGNLFYSFSMDQVLSKIRVIQ